MASEGYQVLIIGDKEHPEVKGIFSYAGEKAVVISSDEFPILNKKNWYNSANNPTNVKGQGDSKQNRKFS